MIGSAWTTTKGPTTIENDRSLLYVAEFQHRINNEYAKVMAPEGRPRLLRSFWSGDVLSCPATSIRAAHPARWVRPSSSIATETTCSGSKPNFRSNSLSGAEAPKVFMPMTRP